MKVLFIGGVFPNNSKSEIENNSKGQPQNAANLLQNNLIRGLDENLSNPVDVFTSVFIGAFPLRYRKLFIHSSNFNHSTDSNHVDKSFGFLNLPVVKHFSKYFSFKKGIRQYFKSGSCNAAIGYSMTFAIVKSLLYVKKKSPKTIVGLVVPDLPEYMNLGKTENFVLRLIKGCSNRILYSDIKKLDFFILLTENMAKPLGIENKPHTVVEGIAPCIDEEIRISKSDCINKNIVYTGSLGEKYGIKDLVDAFHKITNEYCRLIICGGGDSVDYIKQIAKKDQRISYLGILSQEETHKLQREAYLLVNPRKNDEEYTKYSFPSKTMEYMLTGKPVLMYDLQGMPQEYRKHLLLVENEPDGLYVALNRLLEADDEELIKIGARARDFILKEKNAKNQTQKILDVISESLK